MARAGILCEDDRVELLDGEIVEMSPMGSLHQACVDRLTGLFTSPPTIAAIVRVQGSVQLDRYSEPHADILQLFYPSVSGAQGEVCAMMRPYTV
ncbi:MAG: hypothetical protein C4289_00355 [Chloroflexota bacterium]